MNYPAMKVVVFEVDINASKELLTYILRQVYPIVVRNDFAAVMMIKDSFESIYQMKNLKPLMEKCMETGLISILEISTNIKSVRRLPRSCNGFGATEVWLAANGKLKRTITNAEKEAFSKDLENCNNAAREALEQSNGLDHHFDSEFEIKEVDPELVGFRVV